MNIFAKTAGVVLAAAALCGLGVGTAAAATSGQVSGTESTVTVYERALKGLDSVSLPQFTCPSDYPWLYNADLSPGRIVPRGVQVIEPGGIGVTIGGEKADAEGHVIGWNFGGGTATNWNMYPKHLTISAKCTSDPAQAYKR